MDAEFQSSSDSSVPCPWRNLLNGKPFFLASAVLLLFGIYRLSVDPKVFQTDLSQVLFSFGTLETYQWLQVAAACFFAVKVLWDHAFLLVLLQSMIVLTPFILMSHAVFVGQGMTWVLLAAACLGAFGRVVSLRNRWPFMNFPWQTSMVGIVTLVFNSALPILFRSGLENQNEFWQKISPWGWNVCLPLLAAGLLLIPARKPSGVIVASGSWPFVLQGLWLLASTVHLHSIGYVDDQVFAWSRFIPVVFALSWVAALRHEKLLPASRPAVAAWFHRMPFLAGWLPLFLADGDNLWIFALINTALYAGLLGRQRSEENLVYATASVGLLLSALPVDWFGQLDPLATRQYLIEFASGLFIAFHAIRTRKPTLGMVTALGLAGAALSYGSSQPWAFEAAVDLAWLFLLGHSFLWAPDHKKERIVLLAAGISWSFCTVASYGNPVAAKHLLGMISAALTLGIIWLGRGRLHRRLFQAMAGLALLAGFGWPALGTAQAFERSAAGLKLIVFSLVLFVFGVGAGLLRSKRGRTA